MWTWIAVGYFAVGALRSLYIIVTSWGEMMDAARHIVETRGLVSNRATDWLRSGLAPGLVLGAVVDVVAWPYFWAKKRLQSSASAQQK